MFIENQFLQVTFADSDGSIRSIKNKELDLLMSFPAETAENFRLSIPLADDWANIFIGRGKAVVAEKISDSHLRFTWQGIESEEQQLDITVITEAWLEGDELLTNIELRNNSDQKIDYAWYPILGGVTRLSQEKQDDLIHAAFGGTREHDFYSSTWLTGGVSCHWNRYWYTSREFRQFVYPITDTMQWIALVNDDCGLYLSSRDNRDFYTGFYAERDRESTPVTYSIVKACFIDGGERYTSVTNVVSLYKGTWHVAARKYRDWMATWFVRDTQGKWIDEFDGWLSLQAHVGDMHIRVPYEQYPDWLDKARLAGLNTLHIHCGFHDEGIEGGYPYWSNFSKRMGGEETLRKAIARIHEKGGKIITFTKDNKVNMGIPEYDKKFKHHALTLRDGGHPTVCYPVGTLDMLVSGAVLANMCRADQEWQEFITKEMEIVAATGVDGNMIDEWCSGIAMCMSDQHGHQKPYDSFRGQLELGRKIKDASKNHTEEFLLAGEEIWDASYQFMDVSFARGYDEDRFYELYRTALPWLKKTAEILENCYEHLNYAFSCGYIFALTLDYYHGSPEDYPEFCAYFKEIIRIRSETRQFFNHGEFMDNCEYPLSSGTNTAVVSYSLGSTDLIILRGQNKEDAAVKLSLKRRAKTVTLRTPFTANMQYHDRENLDVTIASDSVVVVEVAYE